MRFNEYEQEQFEEVINNFIEKYGTAFLISIHRLHLDLMHNLKTKHFPLMDLHYNLVERNIIKSSKGKKLEKLYDELKSYLPTQRSFNNFLQHYFQKYPERKNQKFRIVQRKYDFETEKLLYSCGYKSNIPLTELIKQLKQEKLTP
ncbi:MAG: hypothetical protein CMF23_14515 [Ignavibacteriae bacterium]|nr:hypothetical protein [Ignavibacteriota bacterium]